MPSSPSNSRSSLSSFDRRSHAKSTAKSLDSLRQLLQASINEEIEDVMQKYIKQYLEPAVKNIDLNQQAGLVPTNGMAPQQYLRGVCRQILEEAKKMY